MLPRRSRADHRSLIHLLTTGVQRAFRLWKQYAEWVKVQELKNSLEGQRAMFADEVSKLRVIVRSPAVSALSPVFVCAGEGARGEAQARSGADFSVEDALFGADLQGVAAVGHRAPCSPDPGHGEDDRASRAGRTLGTNQPLALYADHLCSDCSRLHSARGASGRCGPSTTTCRK